MRIVALDPGGTTGWASWGDDSQLVPGFHHCHLGPDEHHQTLYEMLHTYSPRVIVCESFEYRRDQRDSVVLISREYIGVVKLWCSQNNVPLVMQTAATAKTFVNDTRLQTCGLMQTPKTRYPNMHINDAYRHLIHYMVKKRVGPWKELLEKGWR